MSSFRRKYGKYAIKNLSLVLICCYAFGYVLEIIPQFNIILNYLMLDPYKVVHGQIWRLFTWIFVPSTSLGLFTIITLYFYYSIGTSLERTWGTYNYNVYIFGGMLFTIAGTFLIFLYLVLFPEDKYVAAYGLELVMEAVSTRVSTYYINMSIFLAFACTFPEVSVYVMFLFPVKIKWLGIIDGAFLLYEIIISDVFTRVIIIMSLLNFVLFFVLFRMRRFGTPKQRVEQAIRRERFKSNVRAGMARPNDAHQKCAICGRTDKDYPELDFRYCSKCNGNYEYCNDHLFTHKHFE